MNVIILYSVFYYVVCNEQETKKDTVNAVAKKVGVIDSLLTEIKKISAEIEQIKLKEDDSTRE